MDHKAFLAGIDGATRAAMTAPSNRAGLLHLAGHLAAIGLVNTLIALRAPFWPLLLPVQGLLLIFLFSLAHECTHKTPFADARLNDAIGHLCGLVLLLPFRWFRYFHLAHHRWTNLPGQDPELDGPRPATRRGWFWHVSGLPTWIAAIGLLWRLARGRESAAYLPAGARPAMQRDARIMLAAYAAAALTLLWSPLLFWLWLLPMLIGQPFLRLFLLAEHGDCPAVADMFANTRTTFTTALVRALAWNMPYHVEHHVWPSVPFHKLPQVHGLIRDHLRVTADGYVAFNRAYLARLPLAGAASTPAKGSNGGGHDTRA